MNQNIYNELLLHLTTQDTYYLAKDQVSHHFCDTSMGVLEGINGYPIFPRVSELICMFHEYWGSYGKNIK